MQGSHGMTCTIRICGTLPLFPSGAAGIAPEPGMPCAHTEEPRCNRGSSVKHVRHHHDSYFTSINRTVFTNEPVVIRAKYAPLGRSDALNVTW